MKLIFKLGALFALVTETSAFSTIYTGAECSACLLDTTNYAGVCRSKSGATVSYCCSEEEMETDRNACKESPICSSSIDAINMWPLVCPHEKYPCGANSPEIELRLGLTLTLRVNKLFDLPDSCYYHIFASDQVSADDIEPYNLKHVQVYIESLTGMVGYVSSVNNGIENVVETEITEYNYNFTVPYSDDIYLIL